MRFIYPIFFNKIPRKKILNGIINQMIIRFEVIANKI